MALAVDIRFEGPREVLLHMRCNHYNTDTLLRAIRDGRMITGLTIRRRFKRKSLCVGCCKGKLTARKIKAREKPKAGLAPRVVKDFHLRRKQTVGEILKSSKPYAFELCSDIVGPFVPASHDGYRYGFIFVMDGSLTSWILFGRNKSDIEARRIGKILRRLCLTDVSRIKSIYRMKTDGGGEYLSQSFVDNVMLELGIEVRRVTVRDSSYQNALAERAIRTITESASAIMAARRVPDMFWSDAYRVAVEIRDRLPCTSNPNSYSPAQMRQV